MRAHPDIKCFFATTRGEWPHTSFEVIKDGLTKGRYVVAWMLGLLCIRVDQVAYFGVFDETAAQPLLQFTVGLGLPLVLTQMFGPRIDKVGFDIAIGVCGITVDPPAVGAVAAPYSTRAMDGLGELGSALWTD